MNAYNTKDVIWRNIKSTVNDLDSKEIEDFLLGLDDQEYLEVVLNCDFSNEIDIEIIDLKRSHKTICEELKYKDPLYLEKFSKNFLSSCKRRRIISLSLERCLEKK